MVGVDDLDDDYVAKLLAEDAKKTSQKYLSQGLSAFLPKRRAADAPKPNTRFLSHIVREADTHNAALKRKEEHEAKKRLRELRGEDDRPRKRSRVDETTSSKRNRLLSDIVSAANSGRISKPGHRDFTRRKETGQRADKDDRRDSRRHRHSGRERERESPRRSKSRRDSPESDGVEQAKEKKPSSHSFDGTREQSRSDSEQPVRKRGRGASKRSSGIDDRFEKGYDPAQDVTLDSDHAEDAEDWDMALEAMRDRAKWKRNQACRMREAGFDEKEIARWETNALDQDSQNRDVKNVRWSRKGEVREWDAGKIQQS